MIEVDARGHRCPVPTLRLRRALEGCSPGEAVALLADDPLAKVDVPHFAKANGLEVVEASPQGTGMRFVVRRPAPLPGFPPGPPTPDPAP